MNEKFITRMIGWYCLMTVSIFITSILYLNIRLAGIHDLSITLNNMPVIGIKNNLHIQFDFQMVEPLIARMIPPYQDLHVINHFLPISALENRIGEAFLQTGFNTSDYYLASLSQPVVSAARASVQPVQPGLILANRIIDTLWLTIIYVTAGSLLVNYIFCKGKAIPTRLTLYGLISLGLYNGCSWLTFFIDLPQNAQMYLMLPTAIFVLLLGVNLAFFRMKEATAKPQIVKNTAWRFTAGR